MPGRKSRIRQGGGIGLQTQSTQKHTHTDRQLRHYSGESKHQIYIKKLKYLEGP